MIPSPFSSPPHPPYKILEQTHLFFFDLVLTFFKLLLLKLIFVVIERLPLVRDLGLLSCFFFVLTEGYNSLFKTSLANAGGLAGGLMFVSFSPRVD